MQRTRITAELVTRIDDLLLQGCEHAKIVAEANVTEYVVDVIASDVFRVGRLQPQDRHTCAAVNNGRGQPVSTIRMIRRMLQANILNHGEIAREAGVSSHLVAQVHAGTRDVISKNRPPIFPDLGECFVPEATRCPTCGAMISIIPCRACRAQRN